MFSRFSARSGIRHLGLCLLLALCCLPATLAIAGDSDPGESAEAWLVTYGPGEIYWQRFGHNAIWIRDPRRGLDHAFNFGFFDFAQQNFMLRFLRGRMLYFSAARPARDEFAAYIDENRSIRAQHLVLTGAQVEGLTEYLLREVRPENRDYRYDYYRNNCSTRVRDALDQALGGELSTRFARMPAAQSWRDHTRRLAADDFWLYLGLEIVLGAPVDRPTNAWEEMFIPALLADAVAGMQVGSGGGAAPLASEDVVLFESSLAAPATAPRAWWPRYLLASLAVLAAVWLLCRLAGPGLARGLARSWLLVAGLAGLALLFLWFGTDHVVARQNMNLLVFNPLWLWPAVGRGTRRLTLPVIAGFSLLAIVLPALPPHQYTLDVLAAFLPLNLAAAVVLGGSPRP
jgi:hypothetical protein